MTAQVDFAGLCTLSVPIHPYSPLTSPTPQGWLILHGQHKTPVWTQLNATANVGDTTITVNGVVNWVPGVEGIER